MEIRPVDPGEPAVAALIAVHRQRAFTNTPPKLVFALDADGLRAPHITLWAAWDGAELLGMGALSRIAPGHGEVKSMRTADAALGRGVGMAILAHIIAAARAKGLTRLSLETGTHPAYAPAWRLYERAGFVPCGPFGGYGDEPTSLYYTLAL